MIAKIGSKIGGSLYRCMALVRHGYPSWNKHYRLACWVTFYNRRHFEIVLYIYIFIVNRLFLNAKYLHRFWHYMQIVNLHVMSKPDSSEKKNNISKCRLSYIRWVLNVNNMKWIHFRKRALWPERIAFGPSSGPLGGSRVIPEGVRSDQTTVLTLCIPKDNHEQTA